MEKPKQVPLTIDDYIDACPREIQPRLKQLREIIHDAAPQALEKISYRMPTFTLNGNLVHFAAQTHHIGFYPTPSAIAAFKNELKIYKTSKGAVQFPFDQPLPLDLVRRMVAFRMAENLNKHEVKRKR